MRNNNRNESFYRNLFVINKSKSTVKSGIFPVDDAKVKTKKIPTLNKSKLGMRLGICL